MSCRGLLILSDQPEIKPKSRGGRVASIGDKALIDDRAASWIGLVLATAAGAVSTQNVTQAFVEAYRTNPQLLA